MFYDYVETRWYAEKTDKLKEVKNAFNSVE